VLHGAGGLSHAVAGDVEAGMGDRLKRSWPPVAK
jgi:hypothetical protein